MEALAGAGCSQPPAAGASGAAASARGKKLGAGDHRQASQLSRGLQRCEARGGEGPVSGARKARAKPASGASAGWGAQGGLAPPWPSQSFWRAREAKLRS